MGYPQDVGIYKANKNKSGSVAQFKLGGRRDCMFLEMAKQVRDMEHDAPYDWGNTKICVKLGKTDIGKLLAYFNHQLMYFKKNPEPLKLFHKTEAGTKIIELKWQEKYANYFLTVSEKTSEGKTNRISCPINLDEVELLKIAMKRAVEIILGW